MNTIASFYFYTEALALFHPFISGSYTHTKVFEYMYTCTVSFYWLKGYMEARF